ncbi:MAG TPA: alpha-amylase family glycosyl hydrolase [Candidatus Kapabacteria bacterium]|nr:alpha-amylase family glycosyl hydrolase [Candidatus Kapabacteria bacterium]
MESLQIIEEKLKQLKSKQKKKFDYFVPNIWINGTIGKTNINPYDYFINKIKEIQNLKPIESTFSNWSDNAMVYNLFIRYTSSYDHFNQGTIALDSINGFRSTGTFLKSIALLPYLYKLGINTIYMLPTTSIGIDRMKGTLGSPYAIRNPYIIEDSLSEPILELGSELEFKAMSEATHSLGMKLINEFVFRTASVDSDIALEHPDWFYWIKAKVNERKNDPKNENQYGPPIFTKEELNLIKGKVESGDFTNLPIPHEQHRKMFTKAPIKLARVEQKIIGLINNGKTEVVIPNAFADWPPDDKQPLWSDVTYLKMYEHKDFNYIAYNTIRMYDKKLSKESNENKELWEYITNIIPYYIKNFGIDGIMLDMGHSLPEKLRKEIVDKAKLVNKDFVFWEENFSLNQSSALEGYNAVVGYMPFDFHIFWKVKDIIRKFQNKEIAIHFFATPENHNTPRLMMRSQDIELSKVVYIISKFLPTITFIHNGYELYENYPINTGLDFSEEQIKLYPPESLPLFSAKQMNWDNTNNMIEFISTINSIYDSFIKVSNNLLEVQIELIETNADNLICFKRYINREHYLLIMCNMGNYDIEYKLENITISGSECLLSNAHYDYQNMALNIKLGKYGMAILS